MTLVIGINCGDGVVIGSDSMATTTDPINRSVNIQQYSTKVHIYDNKVIVGVSGSVGMCQLQLDSLQGQWHSKVLRRDKNAAKQFIADTTFKVTQPYIERSRAFHNGRIDDSLITALMVAAPLRTGPVLLEFDHQKAVEEKMRKSIFKHWGPEHQWRIPS